MARFVLIWVFLVGVLASQPSFSWSIQWHGQIAADAVRDLPESKLVKIQRYGDVLKQSFPKEYKRWRTQNASKIKDWSTGATGDARVAAAWLAAWPDFIRKKDIQTLFKKVGAKVPYRLAAYAKHNSSNWHYHNVFVDRKGEEILQCRRKNKGELYTVLSLLSKHAANKTNDKVDAILFSFYIHFIGDLHQPLHNLTQSNHSCFHDLGGNKYCLSNKGKKCALNLHRYWDFAGFQAVKTIELSTEKAILLSESPEIRFVAQTFETWGLESLAFASQLYPSKAEAEDDAYRLLVQRITHDRLQLARVRTRIAIERYLK